VNVDADIARRLAATHDIHAEVEPVAYQVEIAAQPRQADIRRLMVLDQARGDLAEQMAAGQDFDHELSVLGACVLEWKESRLAEIARCCCPLQPFARNDDDIIAVPECPSHGEGVS
jgi:hypothetical protein